MGIPVSVSNDVREGERLFSAYVRQRPDLHAVREERSGSRHPDFTVTGPHGKAICEVFSPELILRNRVGSVDAFSPIARAFGRRKRSQGAQAKADGMPYVVVIASDNSSIPFGAFELLVGGFGGRRALQPSKNTRYSALAVISTMNPTQHRYDAALKARLPPEPDAMTVWRVASALADDMTDSGSFDPQARVARLAVVHNPWAAVELPLDFFGGPHDEQFRVVDMDRVGHLERCWTGWRIHEVPGDDQGQ